MKTIRKTTSKILFLLVLIVSQTSFVNFNTSKCHYIDNSLLQNNILGLYVLKSCENGRFKIRIEKKNANYLYCILDGKKSILKGKVNISKEDNTTYLIFGKIEGILKKNVIQIQNYGNSMNEYNHFTQCDEKYLTFSKN